MGFGVCMDLNSQRPSFFLTLIYHPSENYPTVPYKTGPCKSLIMKMVDRVSSPSGPRSHAINTFMGNFPEGRCGIVGWPESLESISTLESKRQATGRPADSMTCSTHKTRHQAKQGENGLAYSASFANK